VAKITLASHLHSYTGGEREVELDVANVRQMFAALAERYPELRSHLEREVAVAIDGEIYQDALLQTIGAESEVILIPKITGG
jgi:molybdopterin converting factor small subunit